MEHAYQKILVENFSRFAQLTEEEVNLSENFWRRRKIAKGSFFNFHNTVCKQIGLIVKGIFRVYYVNPKTELEHNLFFLGENSFLVSLKSFITQTSCPYYIEALEDSELLVISNEDVHGLYRESHAWERFGRLLAEQYFVYSQARTESFLFQTAEERYLALIDQFPDILNRVSLGHISSYLGIKGPSLSRIRAQVAKKKNFM